MDEMEYLPLTLECIAKQRCEAEIITYICVNQPEKWWEREEKMGICQNNQQLLRWLQNCALPNLHIIDKSTQGKGWTDFQQGVGYARKLLADNIMQSANDDDIFISMDADTTFSPHYCQSLIDNFAAHKQAVAMAVPYYHLLTDRETENRAMLRYEIYTRNYNLNLLRINSPYAYTALGSAIACPAKSYRAVGGFDRQESGEDFYFLRKLRKYGKILLYNEEKVFPAARFSSRVPFGTGPALLKGSKGQWDSYPVFHYSGFDMIAETYRQIPILFKQDIDNEFIQFLQTIFSEKDLWTSLRKNYKTEAAFAKAFHHKVDSLRIFQFLREYQRNIPKNDVECLAEFLQKFYPEQYDYFFLRHAELDSASPANKGIAGQARNDESINMTIEQLNQLRDFLAEQETVYQKIRDDSYVCKFMK
jgi:hypothetical protein